MGEERASKSGGGSGESDSNGRLRRWREIARRAMMLGFLVAFLLAVHHTFFPSLTLAKWKPAIAYALLPVFLVWALVYAGANFGLRGQPEPSGRRSRRRRRSRSKDGKADDDPRSGT